MKMNGRMKITFVVLGVAVILFTLSITLSPWAVEAKLGAVGGLAALVGLILAIWASGPA